MEHVAKPTSWDPAAYRAWLAYVDQPYRFHTESPIERLMVWAIMYAAPYRDVPSVDADQRDIFIDLGDRIPGHWFRVETQVPAGAYTLDILLTEQDGDLRVAVECDGHDFHNLTKEQAEHDRRRDRFLQSEGYRVLRFTGSEIHRNAQAAASEVIEILRRMTREAA